ncbi:lipocalin family protein [Bacteriovoracaceae bacterium]|nr:lipocalin family protein [Bacteriovoracaceae bacterium]
MMLTTILGCSSKSDYQTKVKYVDLDRFMGQWYVIAGRLTSFEDGAHNALETYTWNKEEERIDVDFTMRVDSFKGKLKSIPQKAWVHNKKTNAHWKISPFWPLKLNYLIVEVAEDYSWTVVGVPGQEWVWIMAKEWNISDEKLKMILNRTKTLGYSVRDVRRVPHLW